MMMIERLCIKYLYMRMNSTTTDVVSVCSCWAHRLARRFWPTRLRAKIGGKYSLVGLLSIKGGPDSPEINGFQGVSLRSHDDDRAVRAENNIDALILTPRAIT